MTTELGAGEPGTGSGQDATAGAALPVATILTLCDRLLNEVGRRPHVFTWLRAPDGGAEGWLPVDSYYPAHRLVVMCRAQPGRHDDLYRELVPQRGLRLLQLAPADLGSDLAAARRTLADRLAELEPLRERALEPAAGDHNLVRAVTSFVHQAAPTPPAPRPRTEAQAAAAERAARFVAAHPLPETRKPARVLPVRRAAPARPAPPRHLRRAPGRRRMPPAPTGTVLFGVAIGFVALLLVLALLAWIIGV